MLKSMLAEAGNGRLSGSCYLKQKLKLLYPQLKFVRPSKRIVSEIVFAEGSENSLADHYESHNTSQDTCTEDDEVACGTALNLSDETVVIRNLYLSAIHIRRVIGAMEGMKDTWPITANCFKRISYDKIVPAELFNLLAWIVGASDDVCYDGYVNVNGECHKKLLSLAQDVVYLTSKGRIATPKHVALGMTLRH
jgi:hypothetical protein